MILKCNGKINLSLKITGKREDGYHLLDSVFLPINIFDTIKVNKTKENSEILINNKVCNFNNNICKKIVDHMESTYQIKDKYKFNIIKHIPIGAGLGGGSSDACEIYKFYKNKYNLNISAEESINILSKFGADIPYFLFNKPARIKGIGEVIDELKLKQSYYVLIVFPNTNISTKEVYDKYDLLKTSADMSIDDVIKCLESNDMKNINKYIGNDLEEPAIKICKDIEDIKNESKSIGLKNVLMTGSGSSIFAISNSKNELIKAYKKIHKKRFKLFLTTTKY